MSKLLLINPYFKGYVTIPTLGLGYLAGFIKKRSSWHTEVVEPMLQGLSRNEVIKLGNKTAYIGLTCYTENRFQCYDLATEFKRVYPNTRIIVGGPHASLFPEAILKGVPAIDMVVRFEGEETLLKILEDNDLHSIAGLTFRDNGEIVNNPDRKPMEDLCRTDFPYGDLIGMLDGWKDREVPEDLISLKHIPIMASRGCPYHCTFCGANRLGYQRWRGLDPEITVRQMEHLFRAHGIRYFRFYDPLFYPSHKDVAKFCSLLEDKNLPVFFRIDIRAGTPREILERLWNVGCRVVGLGVESGSDRILRQLNKQITQEQVRKTIEASRDIGLWTIGFFMVSIPNETEEDRVQTRALFNLFDVYNLQFFMIQPGTPMYEEFKRAGQIHDDIWFDRRYEDNIYYCKQSFPSASMGMENAKFAIRYSYYLFNMTQHKKVIRRHGFLRGSIITIIATILCMIIGLKPLKAVYQRVRLLQSYMSIKKFVLNRGVQLYG